MTDGSESYKVITANLLREGSIVYLKTGSDDLTWQPDIDAATMFPESEIDAVLKRAEADPRVVSVYATEVAGRRSPISARERIRAKGPTVKYGHDALAPEDPDFSI